MQSKHDLKISLINVELGSMCALICPVKEIYFVNARHTTSLTLIYNFIIRSGKILIKRVKVGCDITTLTIDYENHSGRATIIYLNKAHKRSANV